MADRVYGVWHKLGCPTWHKIKGDGAMTDLDAEKLRRAVEEDVYLYKSEYLLAAEVRRLRAENDKLRKVIDEASLRFMELSLVTEGFSKEMDELKGQA